MQELNEYKMRIQSNNLQTEALNKKIQKIVSENGSLADEVRNAQ